MNIDEISKALNPDIYARFKEAVEIGKWPDGRALTVEQKSICMQAIIAYEHKHLEEEDRSGYVPPKGSACAPSDPDAPDQLKWRE